MSIIGGMYSYKIGGDLGNFSMLDLIFYLF